MAQRKAGDIAKEEFHETFSGNALPPLSPFMRKAAEKLKDLDLSIDQIKANIKGLEAMKRFPGLVLGTYQGRRIPENGTVSEYQKRLQELSSERESDLKGYFNVCRKTHDPICVYGEGVPQYSVYGEVLTHSFPGLVSSCTKSLREEGLSPLTAKKICGGRQLKVSDFQLMFKEGQWALSVKGVVQYTIPDDLNPYAICDNFKKCQSKLESDDAFDWKKFLKVRDRAKVFEISKGLENRECRIASLLDGPAPWVQTAAATQGQVGPGPRSATQTRVSQRASSSGRVHVAALANDRAFN